VCVFQGDSQTGPVIKLQHQAQKSGVVRSNKVCGHMIDVITENKQYKTIIGIYLKYHNLKV
jgi:hypothetical protein